MLLAGVALPMPPSQNQYWRSRVVRVKATGRDMAIIYTTHEAKAYRQRIAELLLEKGAWYRSANPLRVRLLICPDSDRQMDLDNRCKVALDSLMNGNLFVDDSQIETLELRRGPTLKPAVLFAWVEEFVPTRQDNLAWIKGP